MCGKIRDASHGIALDFDVGTEHLPNKRFKAPEPNDQELVVG